VKPDKPSFLDSIVDAFSRLLDKLGLNGSRLRWKWRQKRFQLGEQGMKTEMAWRSAQAKHKMCPECRSLIDRKARKCTECGESVSRVATPGAGRSVSNLFPGLSAITGLLLLVNGAVYLLVMMAHQKAGVDFSLFGSFDSELLVRFGSGLSEPRMLTDGSVTGGEWWRLITPIFMHGSLMHFFFNSFMLVQIGPLVQSYYGSRFWPIYLLCGIAGSMASQLPRFTNTVGASGAIMGLIGLLFVLGLRDKSQLGAAMKAMLTRLILYMVVLSFLFNIDHLNHIGGFLCGGLLALVVPTREPSSAAGRAFWSVLSVAGVLLVLAAFSMIALAAK
jgi:rhomboid protease GluP